MLAQENEVVISVSDCHAVISRYRRLPNGQLVCACAGNAAELEGEAIGVVTADEQPFRSGAQLPCPPALAGKAHWS